MSHLSEQEFATIFGGSPDEVATGLAEYSQAASLLSSDHPRLIHQHSQEWVGIYQNKVAASGSSMGTVMRSLEDHGIEPKDAIIRFIDSEERTLIL